jgi:hypothetical protein
LKRFSESGLNADVSRVHSLSSYAVVWMASKSRLPRRPFVPITLVMWQALFFTRARICSFNFIDDQVLRTTIGFVDGLKSGSGRQFMLRLTNEQANILAICGPIFSCLVGHSVDFCWKVTGWKQQFVVFARSDLFHETIPIVFTVNDLFMQTIARYRLMPIHLFLVFRGLSLHDFLIIHVMLSTERIFESESESELEFSLPGTGFLRMIFQF